MDCHASLNSNKVAFEATLYFGLFGIVTSETKKQHRNGGNYEKRINRNCIYFG